MSRTAARSARTRSRGSTQRRTARSACPQGAWQGEEAVPFAIERPIEDQAELERPGFVFDRRQMVARRQLERYLEERRLRSLLREVFSED